MKMTVFWVVAPFRLVDSYHSTRRYNPEDSRLQLSYWFQHSDFNDAKREASRY
jgi:hypothetical protein